MSSHLSCGRVLVWFSCGAASAVAAKVAIERYGREREVVVANCDLSKDEHADNARFAADVSRWIGRPIESLRSKKYTSVADVVLGERYFGGPNGAPCTKILKRQVREAFQRPGDTHVFGFTTDPKERVRAADFETNNPDLLTWWPLIAGGITKDECYRIVQAAGIELPAMYRHGFNNNNCIGCVKGGMGYWNKVRVEFPDVFAARAELERIAESEGVKGTILGPDASGRLQFLDQLDPDAGRGVPEPDIDCGLFCARYSELIQVAVNGVAYD